MDAAEQMADLVSCHNDTRKPTRVLDDRDGVHLHERSTEENHARTQRQSDLLLLLLHIEYQTVQTPTTAPTATRLRIAASMYRAH